MFAMACSMILTGMAELKAETSSGQNPPPNKIQSKK